MNTIDSVNLSTIAAIRQRDRDMYRSGGSNLQMREDIHMLLKHLDEILAARAKGGAA